MPRGHLQPGGYDGLNFRAAATSSGGTSTVPRPAGIAVGDLVVVFAGLGVSVTKLSTSGGADWSGVIYTDIGASQQFGVFWKVLNATDVANGWALDASSSDKIVSAAYVTPGTATVTQKGSTGDGAGGATLTGFTPAATSRGALAFFGYYSGSSFVDPSGFTQRALGVGATISVEILDKRNYSSGSVAGTQTGGRVVGFLFEVTP
jgi:hypothetical protein